MFSGIVEGVGRVTRVDESPGGLRIAVSLPASFGRFRKGESLSVSGVCLTALSASRIFRADLSGETLSRTTLTGLRPGSVVNLERAVSLSTRLSGHLVQGHVDGTVTLERILRRGDTRIFTFLPPKSLLRYIVEKGPVAIDGISLTVAALRRNKFDVAVIPHTFRATTFSRLSAGERANLEVDVFAKYVESLMVRR